MAKSVERERGPRPGKDEALLPVLAPNPVEQAAIVLLSMGEQPAAAVLRCLSREQLLGVTQAMSRLSGIKVDAVKSALQRFFDDYREQSGVHAASRAYLKRSLDMALGGNIADSVLDSIYGDAIRPKMARLQWASPKWLADHIADEHVRMQAVFLAFLPPALAGTVIDALPMEGRDLLLLNLAKLDEIDRDPRIHGHYRLDAVRGHLLERAGDREGAVAAYRRAAARTTSTAERDYLLVCAARVGEP